MKKRSIIGTQMRNCTFSLLQTSTVPFLATVISGTDYCKFYCEATGNPNDYCNSFWQGLIEFCVNYM